MRRRKFISDICKIGAVPLLVPKGFSFPAKDRSMKGEWHIEQFKDAGLAHFSYAVLVANKITLIDPSRNPAPYYDFAKKNKAEIVGVIETHPHADFVSSHLQIHKETGATIYTSSLLKPKYAFKAFDEGSLIPLTRDISLRSVFTPGHAPDGISAVLQVRGKDVAVFSGDSLLIGDVGRPDLREYSGDVHTERKELAALMYQTVWQKFDRLDNDVILYPAHGAGSLCGKEMRDADSSTIGYEKQHNHAFKRQTQQQFVDSILSDLPEVPSYFPYDVALNVKGAESFSESINKVTIEPDNFKGEAKEVIVDARPEKLFKASHIASAINIPDGSKFETWLGILVPPDTKFHLVSESNQQLQLLLEKAAKIGYESNVKAAYVYNETTGEKSRQLNTEAFNRDQSAYVIIDVRTAKESKEFPLLEGAINIPLQELPKRLEEIPTNKPVLIHCASGYRSAIGSSLIQRRFPSLPVFDYGDNVLKLK